MLTRSQPLLILLAIVGCATASPPPSLEFAASEESERQVVRALEPAIPDLVAAPESRSLDEAVAARDLGDLARAEAVLRRMLAEAPEDAEAGLACALLGLTLFERVEYKAADGVLSTCPHTGPVADLVAWLHGEVYRGLGRPDDAALKYQAVMRDPRSPLGPNAEFRRADAWFEAERCDLAVPSYQRLLATFPEYPGADDVRFRIAQCAIDAGEEAVASSSLVALWQDRPGSAVGVAARMLLSALERKGVRTAKLTFDEELLRAVDLRGERRWPEALRVLDGLEKKAKEKPQRAAFFKEKARTLEALDRYDDALAALSTAERAGLTGMEETRIRLLRKLGRTDEAVQRSQRRVGSRRERQRIAADLFYRDGQYDKALELYRPILTKRRDPEGRWLLAWLEYRAGNPNHAARAFANLVGRPGIDRDQARYWQARAQSKAGHTAVASRLFASMAREAPLTYYGIQAANRLLDLGHAALYAEITGARPDDIPTETDRMKARGGVAWNGADGKSTYEDVAHRRRTTRLRELADRFGGALPELERALARYRLGLDDAARLELRIALNELRRARGGSPGRLADTAGSLYVDYRPQKRGLWGSRLGRKLGLAAKVVASEETRLSRLKSLDGSAQGALKALLVEVGDPYWTRRTALRDLGRRQWEPPSKFTRNAFKGAYPIVFPQRMAAETERHGVAPFLLTALMRVESGFNSLAVSNAGARGLLQVMPVTGRLIADRIGDSEFSPSDLLDAHTSIEYGSWYIAELVEKFRGQEPLAIISYNAGPHRVHEWLSHRAGTMTDEFIEEVPYTQARKYVKSVLRTVGIYRRVHADRADLYVGQALDPSFKDNINW